MGNDVDMWEIPKICGKWFKYLTNGLNMFKIWEMASIYVARHKYLKNGIGRLQMT